jgi:L-malate glycosyltransferase
MNLNLINLSNTIGGQEIYLNNFIKKNIKTKLKFFTDVNLFKSFEIVDLSSVEYYHLNSITYKNFIKIKKQLLEDTNENDVFIFNGNRAIYLGALISNKYKKVAIQHSSIVDAQEGKLKKFLRVLIYRLLLHRYDRLIGVSENTIKPITDNKKVHVVKNGVDIENFYPVSKEQKKGLRSSLGFNETDKLLLMVGTLTSNKGQLKALSIIGNLPKDFKLILVGDGPLRKDIEMAIAEKRLDDQVVLVGKTSNVNEYYWISDMLLCLSRNEGLPLTILEAMATGLPIITTKIGGIPEVIENDKNGFFVNRDLCHETSLLIQRLVEDKNKINQFRDNNIRKVKDEYTLTDCVDRLIKHFEEVSKFKKY